MATGKFSARFTTGGRLTSLEDWLTKNAKGSWSFKLEDVSEDMAKKNYAVLFSDKEDRDLFRQRFSTKRRVPQETPQEVPPKVATVAADALKSTASMLDSITDFSTKFQSAIKKRLAAPEKSASAPVQTPEPGISVTRSN